MPAPLPADDVAPTKAISLSSIRNRFRPETALLGALAALLLWQLGVLGILKLTSAPGAVVACVVVGFGLGFVRGGRVLVGVDLVFLATYLVVAFTPVITGPIARWVRADSATSRPADAVVVLTSGVKSDSSLDVAGMDRLLTGLEIITTGGAPRIVTTRVSRSFGRRLVSTNSDQRRLIHLARADSAWSEVDTVSSTRDEATRVARLLLPAGARNIVVVTSPMHTRRACATFEAVGFHVRCVPAREHQWSTWHPTSGLDRLAAFREYLYERLGMMKYRTKGWIITSARVVRPPSTSPQATSQRPTAPGAEIEGSSRQQLLGLPAQPSLQPRST